MCVCVCVCVCVCSERWVVMSRLPSVNQCNNLGSYCVNVDTHHSTVGT